MPRRFGTTLARKLELLSLYFRAGFLSFRKFVGPLTLVTRMEHIMDGGKITGVEGEMCAPPFFADADDSDWMVEGPITGFSWILGIIFGAIHLIAWNFFFHSPIERIIWRVASTINTALAVNGFIGITLDVIRVHYIQDNILSSKLSMIISILVFWPFPLYFLMRLVLLVEALISLRDLPSGSLAVVEWTLFIPHV